MDSSARTDRVVDDLQEAGHPVSALSDAREIANKQAVSQEVGVLLIVSGIAGILLPGPVGTPLLILGCVMIWPRAFSPVKVFFSRLCPRAHYFGALQSSRFLSDLNRRYPASR